MVTYTTRSANLMLRALGLSLYLACLGLDAGAHFFDTVFRPEGLLWIAVGFALTVVPVLIMGVIAFRWMKIDFGSVAGMLCGSMANPMALNYVNDTIPDDNPSVSYATVYPFVHVPACDYRPSAVDVLFKLIVKSWECRVEDWERRVEDWERRVED